MIVICGPDGVGKTTLAKKIERKTGLVYQHLSRLPESFDHYWGYVSRMGPDVVYDRFHMCEVAYAYACRGRETNLTPERYRLVDAKLRLLGCVVIVVTAEESLIKARHADKPEMFDVEQVCRANRVYQAFGMRDMSEYESADSDWHLRCNAAHPYPDDRDLGFIVSLHERRQAALMGVQERGPRHVAL